MTDTILVRGALLLGEQATDLLLADGAIAEVGSIKDAAGTRVVDADGLVALPGLVDLHTHLREPGREDAETILTGSRAAAAGGYTAVLAMANTSPVTDTAEAAERVHDLGRSAGIVDVHPVGAVTRGLGGEELAELGLMARSRARVRVFSDDGRCVAEREGHAAGAGVRQDLRRRHQPARPGPRPRSGHCVLPRGRAVGPSRTTGVARGRRGGDRRPRRDARPAHRLARPRRPRLDGRHGRGAALGQGPGHRRDRRGHAPPPAAHHRPGRGLRPDLQGEPAAAAPGGRRGAARGAGRRNHRRRRDRPRPARTSRQGARLRRRGVRDARARDRAARGRLGDGGVRRDDLVGGGRGRCRADPPGSPGWWTRARRSRSADRRTSTLVDPATPLVVDRAESASLSRNNPWHGRTLGASIRATFLRGVPTVLDGKSA